MCASKYVCLMAALCCLMPIYAQADSREPSDQETLMLDLMNRFRANPAREIDKVLLGVEAGVSGMGQRLDVDACYKAVSAMPPVPPLVFNLELMQSARWHAIYMIDNRLTGHFEQAGEPGYTGDTPYKRMTKAGYKGLRGSENAFRNAVSVWNSHRGFIIDWGDGPGGMQDPPGHRLAMGNRLLREVGCAFVVFNENRHGSTVHNLGDNKKIKRLLGGIIYADLNRNDQYDIGEGIKGAPLSTNGRRQAQSWGSGAFRIELDSDERDVLQIEISGKTYEKSIAAGAENVYLQCIMPQQGDAIYMFKQMEIFKLHLDKMTRSTAINMWIRTRGYFRSDHQDALINKHCKQYADDYERDQALLMPMYYIGKTALFKTALSDARKDWKHTDADKFFQDAEKGFTVYQDTKDLIDTIRARTPIRKGRLEETIQRLQDTQRAMVSPAVIESLHVLEIMLTRSVGKK